MAVQTVTEKPDTTNAYMRVGTLEKFKLIADNDRRSIIDTLDVVADEALKSRGLDLGRKGAKP